MEWYVNQDALVVVWPLSQTAHGTLFQQDIALADWFTYPQPYLSCLPYNTFGTLSGVSCTEHHSGTTGIFRTESVRGIRRGLAGSSSGDQDWPHRQHASPFSSLHTCPWRTYWSSFACLLIICICLPLLLWVQWFLNGYALSFIMLLFSFWRTYKFICIKTLTLGIRLLYSLIEQHINWNISITSWNTKNIIH